MKACQKMHYFAGGQGNRHFGHGLLLVAPAVLFMLIFYALPVGKVLILGFESADGSKSLASFSELINNPTFIRIFLNTFETSIVVTVLCLILAYPVAYVLARLPKRLAGFLMIFVLLPFWVSALVRTFAWTVILQRSGPINELLLALGAINQPLSLAQSTFGLVIALTQILLPFMILPLYSVLNALDWTLLRAARSLGAGPFSCFTRIVAPLSVPGIAAGSLLVLILSIGSFITPALLGGRRDTFIAEIIEVQANTLLNWNLAAAMSIALLALTIVLIAICERVFKVRKVLQR